MRRATLLVGTTVALVGALLWYIGLTPNDSDGTASTFRGVPSAETPEVPGENADNIQSEDTTEVPDIYRADLTKPSCLMIAGSGEASDHAIVAIEDSDGYRFGVVGPNGTVTGGYVPFKPNKMDLGVSSNGDTLLGVADLRLNSKVGRPPRADEPVKIFQNGKLVYASEKVLDFGIADDGSSFYVVEPVTETLSRMRVTDFLSGTETVFDVDTYFEGLEPEYRAHFAPTNDFVILEPAQEYSDSPWRFFSTDSTDQVTVMPPTSTPVMGVVFESPEAAYLALPAQGKTVRIEKRRFQLADDPSVEVIWQQSLQLEHFYGGLRLSDDARWLIVDAWETLILDTLTGEPVFTWPIAGAPGVEMARLKKADFHADSLVGSVDAVVIKNGELLMSRSIGKGNFAKCQRGPGYEKCLDEAKRGVRRVVDVFEMNGISLDSAPDRRVSVGEEIKCNVDLVAYPRIASRDGKLIYSANRRE